MKRLKCAVAIIFSLFIVKASYAQDPAFSQFFSSPLNINPALTGNINGDWRFIANFRDQWIGPASPYTTGTASFDRKILQQKMPGVPEGNVWAVGAMLMYDYAMDGIVKSTYASMNLSHSIKLSEEPSIHRLTAGFGGSYGKRFVDFSRIDFEEQFTGYGFNTALPTGEAALYNMKGNFSVNSGVTYSIRSEKRNFDVGVAGFHLNRPKQTFLKDEHERLAMRKVIHANFETFLNDYVVLNTNAIYQNQARAKYYSAGAAIGYFIRNQQDMMFNAGIWYWSKNAVIPYIGIVYNDMQFGFSYDITISSLKEARRKPNTWEFSFIIRGVKDPTNIIPCPWK